MKRKSLIKMKLRETGTIVEIHGGSMFEKRLAAMGINIGNNVTKLSAAMNYFLKGYSPELFLEIPPYRMPSSKLLFKKIFHRIKGFIIEAMPVVLASVLIINILQLMHVFEFISSIFGPVLTFVFGLPKEAIWVLIVGILRKDIAAGMLIPLDLTIKQLVIACVVLSIFFPCIATFVIFLKELGMKRLIQATLIMATITIIVGSMPNIIL